MKTFLKHRLSSLFALLLICALLTISPIAAQEDAPPNRIEHNGQELFLSGINLAWVNFARDLRDFNEPQFVAALDAVAEAEGNAIRWWLHTDGRVSPVYGDDGKVTGLGENDIENMQRALDLAYERGILIIMCLWSHDALKEVSGVPAEWNKLMIEDPEYTQAYIDNALVPMVTALAGHPAIVAWEIFNEPEGVTEEYGWTEVRTTMPYIQQFVNLTAGAIHRADPEALVTNGSWNFRVLTDVDGMTNFYRDDRLIEAGGDPDGTLDFYQVHYYPEWETEITSPFHNPASHWGLDKAIVVGEFPAAGLRDLGHGYRPQRRLMYAIHTYPYLFENGYAGALSWSYNGSQHGGMLDASSGMLWIHNRLDAAAVTVDVGEVDRIPVVLATIPNAVFPNDATGAADYVDLATIFNDAEDGGNMTFEVTENSKPEVVDVVIDGGSLSLNFAGVIGTSSIKITATDSSGKSSRAGFVVQVIDPNVGNVAIGKPAVASSIESGYPPGNATDGILTTRSSTAYSDPQWLVVDLGDVFTINQVVLRWEAAYGDEYDIQAWDGEQWVTVASERFGDGGIDDLSLAEAVDTRFMKMDGISRGAEWGYSLWEFEILGMRSETPNEAIQAAPPEWTAAEAAAAAPAPEMETTALFTFEDDTQGWGVVDFWTAISGVTHTDALASEGASSIAAAGTYSGTAWEEGGIFLVLSEAADWSAYDLLLIDVYAPEAATNFIAQVYAKTGEDWAWANTRDFALTPGAWTTLEADLSSLGNIADVREVGLKIGTSSTAFDGSFFVDNIALATLAEQPVAAAFTLESTPFASFEADAEGWGIVDFWTAITTLEPSSEVASEGSGSLAASGSFSGTAWEEGGIFVVLPEPADWSAYDLLLIDVYAPEGADNFIAQVYAKTGEDWAWANTGDFRLVAGQWNTLEADLSSLGNLADVREVGLKIGTSSTAFDGSFFVDNIALATKVGAEAPVEAAVNPADLTGTALYTFEGDTEGWGIVSFWTAITTLDPSTEIASEGSGSLAASGSFSGTAWEEGGIFIAPAEAQDWSAANFLTVDVYVPEGAANFIAQIYVKTGADWTWANTADIPLIPGEWNTLTADLSTLGDMSEVHEYGVKIGTSVTAFEGTFFVDNVQLLGE